MWCVGLDMGGRGTTYAQRPSTIAPCVTPAHLGAHCVLCTNSAVSTDVVRAHCSTMSITLYEVQTTHAPPYLSTVGIISKNHGM